MITEHFKNIWTFVQKFSSPNIGDKLSVLEKRSRRIIGLGFEALGNILTLSLYFGERQKNIFMGKMWLDFDLGEQSDKRSNKCVLWRQGHCWWRLKLYRVNSSFQWYFGKKLFFTGLGVNIFGFRKHSRHSAEIMYLCVGPGKHAGRHQIGPRISLYLSLLLSDSP